MNILLNDDSAFVKERFPTKENESESVELLRLAACHQLLVRVVYFVVSLFWRQRRGWQV